MNLVNVDGFHINLKRWVKAFKMNIDYHNRSVDCLRTEEEWMELFLKWLEWKTDMHEEYWK